MKSFKNGLGVAALVAVGAVVIVGCQHPSLELTMMKAGDIKMPGVSKIALVDFNSLPDDPLAGKIAADAETCALVQRTVASAFYWKPTSQSANPTTEKDQMFQIANLTAEEAIAAAQQALPEKRFDALVYGRLWWQMTPETDGEYAKKMKLNSWENVPYEKDVLGKKDKAVEKVMTETKDVVKLLKYRTRSAALMLSLSFYRVSGDGILTKIVDTYQVTEQGFTLMNGSLTPDKDIFGQVDIFGLFDKVGNVEVAEPVASLSVDNATGKVKPTKQTATIPTELQAKLLLAGKLSDALAEKVAPHPETIESLWVDTVVLFAFNKCFDAKLTELLQKGAWEATKGYAAFAIRQRLGKELSEKVETIAELKPTYPVAKSEESFAKGKEADMLEYFADEDVNVYVYAIGIACEATGDYYAALDAYTEAFNIKPSLAAAKGIARCYEAFGQAKRLNETNKELKKAGKKATVR